MDLARTQPTRNVSDIPTPRSRCQLPVAYYRKRIRSPDTNPQMKLPSHPAIEIPTPAAGETPGAEHKQDAEHFVAELARALHQNGLASDELEQNVAELADQLNLHVSVFATPTSIFFSFGEGDQYRTLLIRVTPGDINLTRLDELQELQRAVVEERLSLAEGRTLLPEILAHPPLYGPLLTTLAFGWGSAAATQFFGGGVREWSLTMIVGLLVGAFAELLTKVPRMARIYVPLSALFASLVPYVTGIWIQPLSVEIATLGSLIVLLPGLTVTIAINELATQNLAAGTARLAGAVVLLLQLTFGVAMGMALGQQLTSTPLNVAPLPAPWVVWFVSLLTAPTAFAILFRARWWDIPAITATCLLGFVATRTAAPMIGVEISGSVGAFVIGIIGSVFARITARPSSILVVPGLTFLVPGSIGFKSIQLLLNDDVDSAVRGAFDMFLVAIGLVAGLLIAYTLLPNRSFFRPTSPRSQP